MFNVPASLPTLALSLSLLLAACGSTPPAPQAGAPTAPAPLTQAQAQSISVDPVAQAGPEQKQVSYDFSGEVADGPSKGTKLAGKLNLSVRDAGGKYTGLSVFTGALVIDAKTQVPVRGVITKEGAVYIFFDLGAGGLIFGSGAPGEGGVLAGGFLGPKAGDSGRWTAQNPTSPAPAPTPAPTSLKLDFSGEVKEGGAKGTKLQGVLSIEVETRSGLSPFEGDLTLKDGAKAEVKGTLAGDAIFLTAKLGDKLQLFGQGRKNEAGYGGQFTLLDRSKGLGVSLGEWAATAAK